MVQFDAIIFDFDGVLLESEYEGNRHLSDLLTRLGHPTSVEDALTLFTGLSDKDFIAAVESHIGCELPGEFHSHRAAEDERVLREGVAEVQGAVDFVRSLPSGLPIAVASSSSSHWVRTHLEHLGIADRFEPHVYSGREHVERGKPAPDLYLHAAERLQVPIEHCVIIEDSVVGAKGALASGARVIGLVAGTHCIGEHESRLRALGVKDIAGSFAQLRQILSLR